MLRQKFFIFLQITLALQRFLSIIKLMSLFLFPKQNNTNTKKEKQ